VRWQIEEEKLEACWVRAWWDVLRTCLAKPGLSGWEISSDLFFWPLPKGAQMTAESDGQIQAPPRVFISYTHESPSHKAWVSSLATSLRKGGIDAVLDQWDLPLGGDVTLFMEQGIRSATRVLLICTPTYKRKADEGAGGVGYERLVVTGELAKQIQTTKFICVLRDGDDQASIPGFAATRRYIDFRDDSTFENSVEDLLRDLHDAPANPKPQLGRNPFVVNSEITDVAVPVPATGLSAENVFARAEALLSKPDFVGWKRLIRTLRAQIGPDLVQWRQKAEREKWDGDSTNRMINDAVDISAPLMVCAFVAIESEIPQVQDQRGLLDDLMTIPTWNRSGLTVVVEVPATLAYVYHHLVGAFYVASRRHDDAVRLLTTEIINPESRKSSPLWQSHRVMGWPRSLGGNCSLSWKYLVSLYDSQPWLKHFFISNAEYLDGLRAYATLASFVELAEWASRNRDEPMVPEELTLDVPPVFALRSDTGSEMASIVKKAIPEGKVVTAVAKLYGIDATILHRLWPSWAAAWERWQQRAGNHFFEFSQDVPALPKTSA
jgi:hypothetical protein